MKRVKNLTKISIPFVIVTLAFLYCYFAGNKMYGFSTTPKLSGQMIPICCWIVMAISLNLVIGISGELSLGHAGFMSVGAFSGVVASTWLYNAGVTSVYPRMLLTIIFAGFMAMIAGFIIGIPVLRLKGDYLAIVTLAFGEIIRSVFTCLFASIEGTKLYLGWTNGDYISIDGLKLGFSHYDGKLPGTEILRGPQAVYFQKGVQLIGRRSFCQEGLIIGFVLIIITLFIVTNLIRSRSGRAIMAVRDNRIAAESSGVDVMKYRLMAFVISAVLAGMAGALYGLTVPSSPDTFKFDQSILVLVYVVFGGIGSITGSIISTTVLMILPEELRFLKSENGTDFRMLVYAIVLILLMLITNSTYLKSVFGTMSARLKRAEKSLKGDA